VVIDPGHGGTDSGITGPGGRTEAMTAWALAKAVQLALERELNLGVTLTRTEDENPLPSARTGTANGVRADLFLSIHAGGLGSVSRAGFGLFYYDRPAPKSQNQEGGGDEPKTDTGREWPWVQMPHQPASRRLALDLDRAFQDVLRIKGAQPQGLPLAVLAGADMPAVLIEIGNLTDPESERRLALPGYQETVARAFSLALKSWKSRLDDSVNP
jgi:N-acetylmuramoyl-L-alanine amidase